jgi:L-lactate dehydrogenase complex protein LldG
VQRADGGAENSGRDRILARIRAALREQAPKHTGPSAEKVFAPVANPVERFQAECAKNNTECVVVPDLGAAAAAVAEIVAALPAGELFVQDAPSLRDAARPWPPDRNIRWSTEGRPAEASQATVTLAELLVAQTGSVFVSAACGGRGASVVAPVHIVVAQASQLVPDLSAAFARLRDENKFAQNSFLCLITGSSRTADIEKIIVMGAHGPRRLVVVLSLAGE